jgi:hypothetical protein
MAAVLKAATVDQLARRAAVTADNPVALMEEPRWN